jgi:hypothetical protein
MEHALKVAARVRIPLGVLRGAAEPCWGVGSAECAVKRVRIDGILRTATGAFVGDEVLGRDETGVDTADVDHHAVRPAFVEGDATRGRS